MSSRKRSRNSSADDVFAKTPLWYARFKAKVDDFPKGRGDSYTLWQFSSEIDCSPDNRAACLYTVPGTGFDMDVNVFNGTIEKLKGEWPFANSPVILIRVQSFTTINLIWSVFRNVVCVSRLDNVQRAFRIVV